MSDKVATITNKGLPLPVRQRILPLKGLHIPADIVAVITPAALSVFLACG
jgi:hypothetical protein